MKNLIMIAVAAALVGGSAFAGEKVATNEKAQCKQHKGHAHQHGENCGHEQVKHEDHVDYKHDGHMHAEHNGHVDEHKVN